MLDLDKVFGDVERFLTHFGEGRVGLLGGMTLLLDYCAQTFPAEVWAGLRDLDFDADHDRLTLWLADLLRKEPPGPAITGLWFGLFNPVAADGNASCGLYLAGSDRFDPDKPCPDWHCAPEYRPRGRYADSRVLPALYRRTAGLEGDAGCLGEIVLCQGYAYLAVSRWCHGPWQSELLGEAPLRGVAVGHDEGDVHLVAVLRQGEMA
jgi:hypothetical protein